jgi:hypothetical protein
MNEQAFSKRAQVRTYTHNNAIIVCSIYFTTVASRIKKWEKIVEAIIRYTLGKAKVCLEKKILQFTVLKKN